MVKLGFSEDKFWSLTFKKLTTLWDKYIEENSDDQEEGKKVSKMPEGTLSDLL